MLAVMKKTLAPLLILSLLANIALAVLHFRSTPPALPASPAPLALQPTHAAAPKHTIAPLALTVTDSALLSAIDARDSDALIAKLKTLGISADTIHAIVTGLELQKIAGELTTLRSEIPYWRTPNALPLETRKQINRLGSDIRSRLAYFLPQPNKNQYEFLTPERRAELRRLEQDYDDLTAEVRSTSNGFRLKNDYDDLNILVRERKREIDEFFTPDERALHDLRHSPIAQLIKNDYGNIIENEAEYKLLYTLMNQAETDAAGHRLIEDMLGSDRMTQLAQLNDPDTPLVQAAIERLNLPPRETAAALTQIRTQAWQSSATINKDRTLTAAQKRAALKQIAAQSHEQMTAVLGREGASAFATSSRWMGMLRNGIPFTVSNAGTIRVGR
jgi:hypothetical protein